MTFMKVSDSNRLDIRGIKDLEHDFIFWFTLCYFVGEAQFI